MQYIHLHPEVKELLEKIGHDPQQYSIDAINSKQKSLTRFKGNTVLRSLIGDSFDVTFSGSTNSVTGHVKFSSNQSVKGAVIANVAPDLYCKDFQNIFFDDYANSTVDENLREFYELDKVDHERRKLSNGMTLNVSAYKKHFRIWAENNVVAAKQHGCNDIVLPGMGLGIYAGPLKGLTDDLALLGDLQFGVLEEIARKNSDITFRFFGLGKHSDKIGTTGNLTGLPFDSSEPMVSISSKKTLRVVAGSYDIPLGGGAGDNEKIGQDTNVKQLLAKRSQQKVICGEITIVIDAKPDRGRQEPIELTALQQAVKRYIDELKKFITDKAHDIEDPQGNYKKIKSLIRQLKNRDFSRFHDKAEFQALIGTEKELLRQLEIVKENTNPNIFRQIVEVIKDIVSWLFRSFSSERKWADRVAEEVKTTKIEV